MIELIESDSGEVADQCRALGIEVGDTIIGREESGSYWNETKLTLLWIGETVAVWRQTYHSSKRPEWSEPEESADWTLEFRDWRKVHNAAVTGGESEA
ncbi:hypothetical protein GBK02_09020 [Dechloromonas sp. TW-R-39-2]|uniref:DUF7241 domain-containing protein n=1 Tax=Dechloromonas sp. TW-R-39-2 TaxID=2654218 RepID=UPI00193E631C|nr:hypothetical protein [Dechloromonas sp. TW-R-39-2]QRM19532.1 hypothetical protein GBK02_09020 [Dechloromonas sp. TW-R-39-2]